MSETTIEAVGVLVAAYPNANLPDETIRVYVRLLSDIPADQLAEAVTKLCKTSKFMPSVSEIRREVAESLVGLPAPGEAWGVALRYSRDEIQSIEVPWTIRETIIDLGGCWAIRTHDKPSVLRAQFERDYSQRREEMILSRQLSLAPEPVRTLEAGSADGPGDLLPDRFGAFDERFVLTMRHNRRAERGRVDPPDDIEMRAAIAVLSSDSVYPGSLLHIEAQRVLDDADRAISNRLGM